MTARKSGRALEPSMLRRVCDASALPFKTTADISDKSWLIGQERAVEALTFGAEIDRPGFHIFVIAPWQGGLVEAVEAELKRLAKDRGPLVDWVYVHNFDEPRRPRALKLAAGEGRKLRSGIDKAIDQLKLTIPMIFESEEYRTRVAAIDAEMNDAIEGLQSRSDAASIGIVATDSGLRMIPLVGGRPMEQDEWDDLSAEDRHRLEIMLERLQEELDDLVRKLPQWDRQSRERIAELNREIAHHAVEHALTPVKDGFVKNKPVVEHLDAVFEDMVHHITLFTGDDQDEESFGLSRLKARPTDPFHRYRVNLFVDNSASGTAPVVLHDHPTYGRLVGIVEQSSDLGAPAFDFMSIRPGALHKAAGGFLLIDVEDLLSMPFAWEALKRTLKTHMITIDTPRDFYGDVAVETIEPDPIPLSAKVVLIGDRYMHYRMTVVESDFSDLFRVQADLNDQIPWSDQSAMAFAGLAAKIVERHKLRAFDRTAIARLIEESARLSEDSERLSLIVSPLSELMNEADHLAAKRGSVKVTGREVEEAVRARLRRGDLLKERSHEYILREFIRVETKGERVGQINGLVVTGFDQAFGRPARITARVRMGYGQTTEIEQIVDIQREVEMGGSSHSKGVMILGSYLRATYVPDLPICLSATLAFEQSYSFVDGDSASTAELCALLSAIGNIPIRQSLAITGAVSQLGEVQTIGAVNEKIEGFFDICMARGLTKDNGVIIPRANMKDLMLRHEVVDAVRDGKFAIYSVDTVDEAMEVLTGRPAGERSRTGQFPKGSINRLIEDRLAEFARVRINHGHESKRGFWR